MIGGQNQSIAGQPQLLILESDASYYNVIVHLYYNTLHKMYGERFITRQYIVSDEWLQAIILSF